MRKEKPVKEKRKEDPYSVTEVGTLLENIDKSVRQIAEGHVGLDKRLENVEVALHGNSRRLDNLDLGFRVINDKVTRLEDAVSLLSKDLKETREELKGTREELKGEIRELGTRLTGVETHR